MYKKKSKKIKLLFTVNSLSAKGGGAEKILSIVSNELSIKDKYKISVITFDKPNQKLFYNFSSKINIYKLGSFEFFSNKILKNINRTLVLMIYLIKLQPKVSFGFMHSNYINLSIASIISNSRIIACEHIVPEHYKNRIWEFLLIKFTSKIFDKITVVSNQVKKLFPIELRKKMVVINNVVEPIKKKKTLNNTKRKTILSIGRFEEQKNYLTLIYAFNVFQKKKRKWKLKIISDGSQKKDLIKTIKYFKLEKKVEILDYKKDLYHHYKTASMYVCPSIYESFGLTVAEAISFNLPVVAFKSCPGVNELICHKVNGLLVDSYYYDFNTLGNQMIELVENKKMIKKIENYNEPNFLIKNSKNNVIKEWVNLINNITR